MGRRRAALLLLGLALAACNDGTAPPPPAPRVEKPHRAPRPTAAAPTAPAPAFSFSFGKARRPGGWPRTRGVAWQLDPMQAFARARAKKRAVLVYVGSLGCPHCRRLEEGTLSSPALRKALRGSVPLAAYRFQNEDGDASAMAVRVDVTTYPRLRFVDGWGRLLLPPSNETKKSALLSQIARAARAAKAARPPRGADWAAPLQRTAKMLRQLAKTEDLGQLLRHGKDADAVVRLAVLERALARDLSLTRTRPLARELLLDANDHVRGAAYEGLKRLAPNARTGLVLEALARSRTLSAGNADKSELRHAALEALTELAPKAALPAMKALPGEVCGKGDGGCDQLGRLAHALWRKHRDRGVVSILCEMLRHSSSGPRFSAADTRLGLGVLGEVLQKDLLPQRGNRATLRAAARAACGAMK